MNESFQTTTFETGRGGGEECRAAKEKGRRNSAEYLIFLRSRVSSRSGRSADTISARDATSPHFRASDSSGRIATLFRRSYNDFSSLRVTSRMRSEKRDDNSSVARVAFSRVRGTFLKFGCSCCFYGTAPEI